MHYQFSLQVSNTQGAAVAQAVAAAVHKAVEGAIGARVTDVFNPVYTDFDSEGYVSFGNTLPADAAPILMGFGGAIDALKSGKRVTRTGWNGQGMWIRRVTGGVSEYGSESYEALPYIGLKTADNKFVPWLASQADMLAEDWTLSPDPPPQGEPAPQPA